MATYLQGVTDYIPDYQPFQPDLNFYNNVLQTKQTQYDSNWKSLNNLYADLHNADLTHDQNVKKKDDLLKQIDFNLKRVSGLDLSLQQNVDQATQVFRPFYEDKYLMKDMAWTKNYNSTLSRALNLKNTQDEKMRAQYWDTGIKELQYRKDEFKNSTLDETLNMGNATYTPYVNAMEKYLKLAKETGLSIDVKDIDESGMYFVREKNGKALMSPLQNLFMSAYANDPGLQAVYSTQSYVKRKDYAEQYASKFNGNKVEAEKEYLRDQYKFLQNYTAKKNVEAKEAVEINTNKKESTEKAKQDGDASIYADSYLESLDKALAIDQTVANHTEKLNKELNGGDSKTITTSGSLPNPDELDLADLELARLKVDAGTASVLAEQDIVGAADIYAYKDYVRDISANPVGVEKMRHANAMARISYTHQLKEDEIKLKNQLDLEKDRIKQGLADGTIYYDKDGKRHEDDGSSFLMDVPWISGLFSGERNVDADNRKKVNEATLNLTSTYIGSTLTHLKNLAYIDENGKRQITSKELWNALSWLDPNSKEAAERYGTKSGYKLLDKIWNKYQREGDKFLLEFSKTNQVLKLKNFMDGWANKNAGHNIAKEYHNDKSVKSVEEYSRFKKQVDIIEKENHDKITSAMVKALSANEDFKKLMSGTKTKIAEAYTKYSKQHSKFNYNEFAKIIDKELGYKTEIKKWSSTSISPTINTTVGSDSGWSAESGFSKKTGVDLGDLYENLSQTYLKAVNATGPEQLKSYNGYVRTAGGRYALGAKGLRAKKVILSNPSFGGFQDFQDLITDVNRIRFGQNSQKYAVTIGGSTISAAENDKLDAYEAKSILRAIQMSAKKGTKTPPFLIGTTAFGLENPDLRTAVFYPPQEILKKYILTDKGNPDYTRIKKINANGISFVAPKNEWSAKFIHENDPTPTEMLLNAKKKISYTHGEGAGGYQIEKVSNTPGVDYRISFTGKYINDDGSVEMLGDAMPLAKSGNYLDDTETQIFDRIQDIAQHNAAMIAKFRRNGEQDKLDKVKAAFGNAPVAGFKY